MPLTIVRHKMALRFGVAFFVCMTLGATTHGADDLVQIIVNPDGDAAVDSILYVNGKVFFTAVTAGEGRELWKSDGTQDGTALVKDISPGPGFSNPQFLTHVNGTLFFSADDGVAGYELWKSDGTVSGTVMVRNIVTDGVDVGVSSYPANLMSFEGVLYFSAWTPANGRELWKSDGTQSGTVEVANINPNSGYTKGGPAKYESPQGSFPENFTPFAGELFFSATDGLAGRELWKTDGTTLGTVLVKDINDHTFVGSDPEQLTVSGGVLYFTADDAMSGRELWMYDGVTTSMFAEINVYGGSFPEELTDVDGSLVLTAYSPDSGRLIGILTDGDENSLPRINPDIDSPSVPYGFTPVGDALGFVADDGIIGVEPWKAQDGFLGPVKDINLSGDSNPNYLTKVGRRVYFSAIDGVHGWELWVSDGSFNGTGLIKDINTIAKGIAEPDSYPESLTDADGILFFTANDGVNGRQLYTAGTKMVEFADPDFEIAVRDVLVDLGTNPGPTIEDNDLVGVGFTRLFVEDIGLSDPSGIEAATDLEALGLAFNRISALYTLTDMINLRLLDLSSNQISNADLVNLGDLTNLEFLNLNNNLISDLASLYGVIGLMELRLENNVITELAPLFAKSVLAKGSRLMVRGNDLSQQSLCNDIPYLQGIGVAVIFDGACNDVVIPPDEFVSIKGTIFEKEKYGTPLSCATVVATNSQGEQIVATTGFDGRYAFLDIPVDEYILEAQSPGFARSFATVTTSEVGEVTLDFAMEIRAEEGSVIGQVIGAVSQLFLVGVRVDAFVNGVLVDSAYTCAEGRFEVRIPIGGEGDVRLEFSAPGFVTAAIEDPNLQEDVELDPGTLLPGNIFGTVRDDELDTGIENANVFVTPSNQSLLSFALVTNSDGLFVVPNVGAGDFEIQVQVEGEEIVTEMLHRVTDAEQSTVTIVFNRTQTQGCGSGVGQAGGASVVGDSILVMLAIGVLILSQRNACLYNLVEPDEENSHGE